MPSNGLSFWGKVGVRLCPLWTAKSSLTHPETLKRLARDCGNDKELRRAIVSNENVPDEALKILNVQRLTIVHINDIHATYMEDVPATEGIPGQNPLSRLCWYVDQVRAENPHTLFTFGGDFFEKGSVAELLSRGRSTLEVFRTLGFDVAVIGNHDFAWSCELVLEFIDSPPIMLASNVKYVGDNPAEYKGQDFAILSIGALSIGVFGMVSKGYNELDEQTDVDYYPAKLRTRHDYVQRAREIVEGNRGIVDLMFMLSHIGLEADKEVADKVPDLHVVLSGHSHDPLEKPVVDRDGTIIAQTDAYARNLVRMDLFVDLDNRRIMHHDYKLVSLAPWFTSINSNEKVAREIKAISVKYAEDADVSFAKVSQECSRPEIARVAAEAAIHHLEVDAAIVDIKTVWKDKWKSEDLTQQKLGDTFEVEREPAGTPGFSSFYTVDINGDNLNKMLNSTKYPGRWVYSLPPEHKSDETYQLALSKKQAMHIDRYFGEDIEIISEQPREGCEIWEAVYEYGVFRNLQKMHIDSDEPVSA